MQETIDAIYQQGVLKPLKPLPWIPENHQVKVTVSFERPKHPMDDVIGILSDEDAREIEKIIEDEFEKVDPDEWK